MGHSDAGSEIKCYSKKIINTLWGKKRVNLNLRDVN
jgi:hypothetical protein